jgi:4-alpha-glucanotransferase
VAHDSADVWTHPELFQLDSVGRPCKVAGVPPDYFSETGQLWGNPIYDWSRLADSGYDWWVRRVRSQLAWTDRIRLDHFRAFQAYWEVDAAETSAVRGHWVPGPGQALFDALEKALGGLPFVAEDLGSITEEVRALRQELGLPGMRVLQFGLDSGEGEHLPANFPSDCVAYTGTHDNDTSRGWFQHLGAEKQRRVREMLDAESGEVVRRMIESAYRSPAQLVVVPMQDLLNLGSEARMNTPAVATGNWSWRVTADQLSASLASRMLDLAVATRRVDGQVRR